MFSPIQPFLLRASLLEVAGTALYSVSRQPACHTSLCQEAVLRVKILHWEFYTFTYHWICSVLYELQYPHWVHFTRWVRGEETVTWSQECFMSYVHYNQNLERNPEINWEKKKQTTTKQWSVWLAWVLLTDNIFFPWKLGKGTNDGAITQISEVWWLFAFLSNMFVHFALGLRIRQG